MELSKWCISHLIYGSLILKKWPISFMLSNLIYRIIPIILWLFFWCVKGLCDIAFFSPSICNLCLPSFILVVLLEFQFYYFQINKFCLIELFLFLFVLFSFSLISDHVFIISFLFSSLGFSLLFLGSWGKHRWRPLKNLSWCI